MHGQPQRMTVMRRRLASRDGRPRRATTASVLLGLALVPNGDAALRSCARAHALHRATATCMSSSVSPSRVAGERAPSDWGSMRALAERVRALQSVEVEHLMTFHNPHSGAFVVEPQLVDRVSVVSSCNVVRAMLTNEEGWARVGRPDLDLGRLLTALLDAPWVFDPLQTPVALAAIVALHAGLPSHPKARLALAHTCLSVFRNADVQSADVHVGTAGVVDEQTAAGMPLARAALVSGRAELGVRALVPGEDGRPPPSSYVRYQNAHALVELVVRVGWQPTADRWLAARMGEVRAALERAAIDAYRSICEQMALRAARADEGSDAIRLGFDLCTYYEASSALAESSSFFGKATRAPKVNLKLTAHVLRAIFSLQKESGLWPKGEPIASRFQSRDLGNSFVFSFDLLDVLLQTIGEEHPELFREHLGSLELAVGWAEASIIQTAGTAAWYAARGAEGATHLADEAPAGVTRGWRSSHLSENGGPLCWSSAQVCSALSSMRCLLRKLCAEDVLSEFRATRVSERSTRLFDSLMDSEVQLAGGGAIGVEGSEEGCASLKRILSRHILEPLADAPAGRRPLEGHGPKQDAKFSAILCAPRCAAPPAAPCRAACTLRAVHCFAAPSGALLCRPERCIALPPRAVHCFAAPGGALLCRPWRCIALPPLAWAPHDALSPHLIPLASHAAARARQMAHPARPSRLCARQSRARLDGRY